MKKSGDAILSVLSREFRPPTLSPTVTVRIKCFASLREALGVDARDIAHRRGMTVADAWRALSDAPPPDNLLCARNHEYADFKQAIDDGDEIAFFPPVTGG